MADATEEVPSDDDNGPVAPAASAHGEAPAGQAPASADGAANAETGEAGEPETDQATEQLIDNFFVGEKRPRSGEDDDARSVRSAASASSADRTPRSTALIENPPGSYAKTYVPGNAQHEEYRLTFDASGRVIRLRVKTWEPGNNERTGPPAHEAVTTGEHKNHLSMAWPERPVAPTHTATKMQLVLQALAAVAQSERKAWEGASALADAQRLGGTPTLAAATAAAAAPRAPMAAAAAAAWSAALAAVPAPPAPSAQLPMTLAATGPMAPPPLDGFAHEADGLLDALLPPPPPPPSNLADLHDFGKPAGAPKHTMSAAGKARMEAFRLFIRHDLCTPNKRQPYVCGGERRSTLLGRFPHAKYVPHSSSRAAKPAGDAAAPAPAPAPAPAAAAPADASAATETSDPAEEREIFLVTHDRKVELEVYLGRASHPANAPRDRRRCETEETLRRIVQEDAGELWSEERDGLKMLRDEKHFNIAIALVFNDGDSPWERTVVEAQHFNDGQPNGGNVFVPNHHLGVMGPYHKPLDSGYIHVDFVISAGAYTSFLNEEWKGREFRIQARCSNPHARHLIAESVPFVTKALAGRNILSDDRYVRAPLLPSGELPVPWYTRVTDKAELAERGKRPKMLKRGAM